ncbi:MAG: hypothetical protein HZB53_03440 [Chloroflexi bacterium]|nr:hypothetical protein [Chloroflexota bacterium]
MAAYNGELFSPAAPVARVELRHPHLDITVSDVLMLMDTGADVTLVPIDALKQLGIDQQAEGQYELIGYGGGSALVNAARLEMHLGLKSFRGLFLSIDQSWGILGRNVLNSMSIRLDGPHLEWTADEE